MIAKNIYIIILGLFITGIKINAQTDSTVNITGRKILVAGGTVAFTTGSLIYLNNEWYSPYNTGRFHFFNDNGEWLQMDKLGHVYSTYQTGRLMMESCSWAGFNNNQKFAAGAYGLLYLSAIEIMDGYSRGWGFSWGDMLANVSGAALVITQEAIWKEQKFNLKFSYSESGLAKYNSSLLGEDLYSRIIKDYNGQSYWLSFGPAAFIKKETNFPQWLNIAIGYGANGMLGGHYNNVEVRDDNGNPVEIKRSRSYYLSLDLNLTKIKTKSKFLKTVFSVVNILKFPAPALELSDKKLLFHPIYY